MKWVLILSFLFLPQAFADGINSGWSLSTNVDDAGTMSYGSGFSASTTGGFSTGGTQTASRTSTSFTKFTFTTYSGTSPWASNWNAGSSYYQVYGIQTSDFLITQPVQSTEVQPIFTVDTACPSQYPDGELDIRAVECGGNNQSLQYVLSRHIHNRGHDGGRDDDGAV